MHLSVCLSTTLSSYSGSLLTVDPSARNGRQVCKGRLADLAATPSTLCKESNTAIKWRLHSKHSWVLISKVTVMMVERGRVREGDGGNEKTLDMRAKKKR